MIDAKGMGLSSKIADYETMRNIFENAMRSIDRTKSFPEKVFCGTWNRFLFFQSDWVFAGAFVNFVRDLLDAEGAKGASLINLSRTAFFEWDKAAQFHFDATTEDSDFEAFLRGNGPASGWLYTMDKYVCASDIGGWSVYCEKENDIAVIALRSVDGVKKFHSSLRQIQAAPFNVLSDAGGPFPFSQLTKSWRNALTENYQ